MYNKSGDIMSKLVLIGGGELGINYSTKEIDEEIVRLTNKKNPIFVFIGFASNSSESYFDIIKRIYTPLGCSCLNLKRKNLIKNYSLAIEKIRKADIIYISGGDTIKLINEIKEFNLEKELENAIENDCVVAGISAGGILLSKEGYSDSLKIRNESDKYTFIKGLNYTDILFCPHYNIVEKKNELKGDIINTNNRVYSLEDNTALEIINNKIKLIKSNNNSKAYLCYYKNNEYVEEEIYE